MQRRDPDPQASKLFMSWRDLVLTPLLELALFGCCAICTVAVHRNLHPLDAFSGVVVFYGLLVFWTLLVLGGLRACWPLKSGIYTESKNPWRVYRFNLQGFLCCFNLGPLYLNGLMPMLLRKPFYQLLGATIGKNILVVAGSLVEPDLVQLEDNVLIGSEAVLSAHVLTFGPDSEPRLILGKITIRRGAIIGARAMISPSVTVGENSVVNPMSLVPAFTVIPPNEIWGGVPVRKIAAIQRSGAPVVSGSKPVWAGAPQAQPAPGTAPLRGMPL